MEYIANKINKILSKVPVQSLLGEYSKFYGVNENLMKYAKKDAVILHPGPVNRGVELTPALIDGKSSCINEQVTCGLAVRMAVLKLLAEYRGKNL